MLQLPHLATLPEKKNALSMKIIETYIFTYIHSSNIYLIISVTIDLLSLQSFPLDNFSSKQFIHIHVNHSKLNNMRMCQTRKLIRWVANYYSIFNLLYVDLLYVVFNLTVPFFSGINFFKLNILAKSGKNY